MHIDPAIMNTDPNSESVETPELVSYTLYTHIPHIPHIHTHITTNICGDCGEAFSNRDDFSSHYQRHGSKFACFVCDERFAFLKDLKLHIEWHFDEIPYTCYCSAKFSTSSMCEKHVSEHNSGRKFKCNKCDNEYSDFNEMKIHMQIHFSSKTLKSCLICGRGFSRQSQLRVHLGTDHSTEKLCTPI